MFSTYLAVFGSYVPQFHFPGDDKLWFEGFVLHCQFCELLEKSIFKLPTLIIDYSPRKTKSRNQLAEDLHGNSGARLILSRVRLGKLCKIVNNDQDIFVSP